VPVQIACVWWALTAVLALVPAWHQVELKLLDKLVVATAPNQSRFPITVIGIDAESFSELGLQWPWPRSLHADLLDRLVADGASVVVFDVLFSESSGRGAQDDQLFADSIRSAGNVVIAADRVYRETAAVSAWQRFDPLSLLLEAGAQAGLATVPLDPDLVVRQAPEASDALWRTTVLRLIRSHPELAPNLGVGPNTYIRYAGGDHTFPYVSYHEIVKPNGSIPDGYFKDQVVIVGFVGKGSVNAQSAQADLFHTPFLASTGGLMPGAEVHANLIETALSRNAISASHSYLVLAMLAMTAAACARWMRNWRPLGSALVGCALMVLVGAAAWMAMIRFNLWLPIASTLALVLLMYISLGGRSFLAEQARRNEITRAFSLYVTPQVVAHMIDNPQAMNLGGVRRDITVMFTDLAGFTTISEKYSAEQVTHLLNRHFTAMTDIVLEHHGTVARFIGDAIMAFWGAPLDDDDQAWRAVAAAVAMQQGMVALRAEFEREGLPPIFMRVGIHGGSAIVGNLGSDKRFDYTAIGDDVNVAARLEGTNKYYATEILVSEETARQVGERICFRPIDKVIVKGKTRPIEIFTPCDDATLVALTAQAIALFRNRDWDATERVCTELLAYAPGDNLGQLYMQRIARFRIEPPAVGWDGAVELEK
jgi:adenylate cyclase